MPVVFKLSVLFLFLELKALNKPNLPLCPQLDSALHTLAGC
jgi:hypothetical protein